MYRWFLRTLSGDHFCPVPFGWGVPSGRARHARRAIWRRMVRPPRWVWALVLAAVVAGAELRTSRFQAMVLAWVAQRLTYVVEPEPTAFIRFPTGGPHDRRLGYVQQPEFVRQLTDRGFQVHAQARWAPALLRFADAGFFPSYAVKSQAGLSLLDQSGRVIFGSQYPRRAYNDFGQIPALVVQSLLFIENRELLQTDRPYHNPAVEYDRLAKAVLDVGLSRLLPGHPVTGGSTLAVQLEKLRHSPEGRTASAGEKGRQIVSASLRSYRDGEQTIEARKRLVTDYLNAMPLGAVPGHGEVTGLGDGLLAWYGEDVERINAILADSDLFLEQRPSVRQQAARAYRATLTLLVAVKKPTVYLSHDLPALDARTDAYLGALASAGIIPPWLRDETARIRLTPRERADTRRDVRFAERKAIDAVRIELSSQLGVPTLYDLDRLDLAARTTLNGGVNEAVTHALQRVSDCGEAARAGLVASRLLQRHSCGCVVYSFTLYERVPGGNALRVQADNYDQPLNINEGTKLELGSTAKLRTLVTYLELIEALHHRYSGLAAPALNSTPVHRRDRLSQWAIEYLAAAKDRSLPAMLDAAMNRTYSASPHESFFTGGGVHRFENFDAKDDGRVTTVRDAFQRSVNLAFIRLMRDLVEHLTFRRHEIAEILEQANHPARRAYLGRFADWEGREFLRRFYARHHGGPADEPRRTVTQSARRHPLEVWLLRYLAEHPHATLGEVFDASTGARQDAYEWLFTTPSRAAQNRAIRIGLEVDAFAEIHASWSRHGYPFSSLVPSYATAIGSSGDNPVALSALMGTIAGGGVRYPSFRIEQVHFAAGTPYDTRMSRTPAEGTRVLSPAVASLLQQELVGVVERGTGRRLAGGVRLGDGRTLALGGKTGTGDNRFITDNRSRVVNRTAAFAFMIGDRFFGSVVAYVPGQAAAAYEFTSALPVQLLKHLLPAIQPLVSETANAPGS